MDIPERVESEKKAEEIIDLLQNFEYFADKLIKEDNYKDLAYFFIWYMNCFADILIRFQKVLMDDPKRAMTAYTNLKNVQDRVKPFARIAEVLAKMPSKYEHRFRKAVEQAIPVPEAAENAILAQRQALVQRLDEMLSTLKFYSGRVWTLADELGNYKAQADREGWSVGGAARFFGFNSLRANAYEFVHIYENSLKKLDDLLKNIIVLEILQKNKKLRTDLNDAFGVYKAALIALFETTILPTGWSKENAIAFLKQLRGTKERRELAA